MPSTAVVAQEPTESAPAPPGAQRTDRVYVVQHDAIGASMDNAGRNRGPWVQGETLDDSAFNDETVETEPDHLLDLGAIRIATPEEAAQHRQNPLRVGVADVPGGGWARRRALKLGLIEDLPVPTPPPTRNVPPQRSPIDDRHVGPTRQNVIGALPGRRA